jgi:hypothetical protein
MVSGYATLRPRSELLEVLASIAAYQDRMYANGKSAKKKRWGRAGAWCIVRQREIAAWYARFLTRFGRPERAIAMSRRTLNYQLAGLERDRFLARQQRHTRARKGTGRKLDLRPSLYTFTTLGRLWISRRIGWVASPLDHLAVQRIAQSGVNSELVSSTSLSSVVDKTPTTRKGENPRKSAALRRRTSSTASRAAAPRPAKSAVRGRKGGARRSSIGAKSRPGRARKAANARNGRRRASRST